MANIIVVKHRSGASGDPSGLLAGEIAANINDRFFYVGTGAGNLVFADKAYVDASLAGKADTTTVYTQAQIDSFLGNKANLVDVYTKAQVDSSLGDKADATAVYTKSEVDTKISDILDGAPAALDTLNEIAAAINDDANFAATITAQVAAKIGDAPSDGKDYARRDGAWVEVTSGGGDISNATIDGGVY